MRMTKFPDGNYVAIPETEEERDIIKRWKAAYDAFLNPDHLPPAILVPYKETLAGEAPEEPDTPPVETPKIEEEQNVEISLFPCTEEQEEFFCAWAAAFNAFMEYYDQGVAAEQATGHCKQSNAHGEDPSQYTDDLSHEAQA